MDVGVADPLAARNARMDAWVRSRPIKVQLRRLSLLRDVAHWVVDHGEAGSATPPPDVPITARHPDGSVTTERSSECYPWMPPPCDVVEWQLVAVA